MPREVTPAKTSLPRRWNSATRKDIQNMLLPRHRSRMAATVLAPRRALASRMTGPATGWTPIDRADPRQPTRFEADVRTPGPWCTPGGPPMHGIVERDRADGLVDWAAVLHGWCLWRWAGPRMDPVLTPAGDPSPLISVWNPILAQDLAFAGMRELGLSWPVDCDDWTAEAILRGWKTGATFSLPPRSMRAWRADARDAGLAVRRTPRGWWVLAGRGDTASAAQPGTLTDHLDLAALTAQYTRVLPAGLAADIAADLTANADRPLLSLVDEHEEVGYATCGLVLGYPPEVTAGVLLRSCTRHDRFVAAEYGAHCPRCDRPRTSTGSGRRRDRQVSR
jgi:hypothetical protein